MINVIQMKIAINVCEEVSHPQSLQPMPGVPIEQTEVTLTTRERNIEAGVRDLCRKAQNYATGIAGATSAAAKN